MPSLSAAARLAALDAAWIEGASEALRKQMEKIPLGKLMTSLMLTVVAQNHSLFKLHTFVRHLTELGIRVSKKEIELTAEELRESYLRCLNGMISEILGQQETGADDVPTADLVSFICQSMEEITKFLTVYATPFKDKLEEEDEEEEA